MVEELSELHVGEREHGTVGHGVCLVEFVADESRAGHVFRRPTRLIDTCTVILVHQKEYYI